MGTWSAGSFGNDDALDYVDGLSSFDAAIETVMAFSSQPENLAVGDACVALGASDLLAAGLGRPPADLPEAKHISLRPVSEDVLEQARTLIDHVRTTSELAELWEDDVEEWHEALDALVVRLTPSAPYTPPKQQPELPADFLGYCYVCREMVTARDGLEFCFEDGGGWMGLTAHRACIDAKLEGSGPHWTPEGAPLPAARRQLVIGMGYAPEDLTENGDVLPAARRRMMLEIGYKESDLTEDGHLKPKEF
ncbi:DUF4259 domain-containing protein [Tateyamaria sp. ANG-S1]|uniref:DUF4259 domain-containing protein n=1 Tax=Tateyamaria sp. ANG-S1 TaxID=1577905 RepID=UPI0005803586|nr:DUF4259 domain-containing protein [Tateyamaria sp. ANG-S1]KIC49555.1 hypothetical protein RA29_07665 [Tateyamaria sp. ANG-S1]